MTPKQEDALLDYLQEVITPLIEQVLVKKLGQAMMFAKEELIQPKREWHGLTDEDMEFWTGELGQGELGRGVIRAVADHLKEKNT